MAYGKKLAKTTQVSGLKLLSTASLKTVKGEKQGVLSGILYLSPAKSAGTGENFCPSASPGCIAACLYNSGASLMFKSVNVARARKSHWFMDDRDGFMQQLVKDIKRLVKVAHEKGLEPAVRLNGTSDIAWESLPFMDEELNTWRNIMVRFPDVQFYDYTKREARMHRWTQRQLPQNYHLTFSRSEINDMDVKTVLRHGGNVAVVFRTELPDRWNGARVINGDESDVRFRDPNNVVVGLVAKAKAKKDETGFVV